MANSAARIELTIPSTDELRALAAVACQAWTATREGALRLICTRGPEESGVPTVYATVSEVGEAIRRQRRDGIRVSTASLGVAADARQTAPWLLAGVKSLSYASNMAALRWAAAQGVDDVLYISTDGQILEGPTASVVWISGDQLCSVPASTGILPGTTAAELLSRAGELGLDEQWRTASLDELRAADGIWFCSSVRGVAGFVSLDESAIPTDPSRTAQFRSLLGFSGPDQF
jgi:4-amino-4-deoxychorismate lyase